VRSVGAPLVGRDEQLAMLGWCVERVAGGEGVIAFVTADAGVGKSRLVAEARRRAPTDIRWLEGRTLSFGRTLSYWPFLEIVRSWAGIEEHDDHGWPKLDASVRGVVGDEAPDLLPYLAALLGIQIPAELEDRVRYLEADGLARQIFRASWRLFAAIAVSRPLGLVFEDWHWADESSAELLEHLLGLVDTVPLLVVCISRPEVLDPLAPLRARARDRKLTVTEIALTPLDRRESMQLVEKLLETDDLPAGILAAVGRAEGNPFFLEELVRMFADDGVLQGGAVSRAAAPATVRGIVAARVDRLDESLKEILRVAAVIGRFFTQQLVSAVHDVADLDDSLRALERVDLIRRLDPEELAFRHALTQEAVYDSILLTRRRELHERVAVAIEQRIPEAGDETVGVLAYHYARAERWDKAQEYLLRAGDYAREIAADAEALAYYRDALKVSEERLTPLERAQLNRKIGEAFFRRGENERALESLQRALTELA